MVKLTGDPRYTGVYFRYYYLDETQREIARDFGVTIPRIGQKIQQIDIILSRNEYLRDAIIEVMTE